MSPPSRCLVRFLFLILFTWLCWVSIAAAAFSSCSEQGLLTVAACRLLIVEASLAMEHGLWALWASVVSAPIL